MSTCTAARASAWPGGIPAALRRLTKYSVSKQMGFGTLMGGL